MDTPTPGTVNVPKVGRVKKVYVYGGVAVVGVLAIVYYRNHKAAGTSAAATSSSASGTDPAGNVGVIDPATGYVEGSPEDLSALSSSAGFNPGVDFSAGGGGSGSVDQQITNGPPFTSNAAWSQYVLSKLPQAQDDPSGVASTLGAYLAGSQVSPAQADTIHAADALAGPPPTAGPNGMPPSINVAGSTAGGGPPPGPTATPPNLTHTTAERTTVGLRWTATPGATEYRVYEGQPSTGHNRAVATLGGSSRSYNVSGLHPGTRYEFFVQPFAGGKHIATSNTVEIQTRS